VEAWLVGQYAVGDTMQLLVSTADNQKLGELTIEIGSERRDIPIDGHFMSEHVPIEVKPDWIGAPGLSVEVTDAQGLAGPRHEVHPDSIRVFPVTPRPMASWSAEGHVADEVWDDARGRLYLLLGERTEVVVLSFRHAP
jgi:hypothetical protein